MFNFTTDTVYMGIKKITEKKHKQDKLFECVYAFIYSWSYFVAICVFDKQSWKQTFMFHCFGWKKSFKVMIKEN